MDKQADTEYRNEIIEMAKEAGFPVFGTKVVANDPMQQLLADAVTQHYHDSAIQFAKLVAADADAKATAKAVAREREACAKVCDEWESDEAFVDNIADAIRARGSNE